MMAKLFTRMKQTVEADLHDLLDKKVQKNPLAQLNQYLRQSEREVEKVHQLIKRQYVLIEEMNREFGTASEMAAKRKYQAEIAAQADGQQDLYEFAIKEQTIYEERAAKIEHIKVQLEIDLKQLESKYELMKQKLKDMHIKRLELMGRENVAKVHYRMDKLMDEGGVQSAGGNQFNEMENYMEQLENQIQTRYNSSTIDSRIADLEKELKKEVTPN